MLRTSSENESTAGPYAGCTDAKMQAIVSAVQAEMERRKAATKRLQLQGERETGGDENCCIFCTNRFVQDEPWAVRNQSCGHGWDRWERARNMQATCCELFPIDAQGHATVPEGETELPEDAFRGCTSLASITLPASLISIGKGAFLGCRQLVLTSLPDGLISISDHAFEDCTSLALTSLPDGLANIGAYAFMRCTSLALTSLPDGLTSIDDYAFYGCGSLVLASLPDGITSIGIGAFRGCGSLALASLPNGLTSIGDRAFRGCASLGPYLNWHTF